MVNKNGGKSILAKNLITRQRKSAHDLGFTFTGPPQVARYPKPRQRYRDYPIEKSFFDDLTFFMDELFLFAKSFEPLQKYEKILAKRKSNESQIRPKPKSKSYQNQTKSGTILIYNKSKPISNSVPYTNRLISDQQYIHHDLSPTSNFNQIKIKSKSNSNQNYPQTNQKST